jgi:hypothetical protein
MTNLAKEILEAFENQPIAPSSLTGLTEEENKESGLVNGYFLVAACEEAGLTLEAHQRGIHGTTLLCFRTGK